MSTKNLALSVEFELVSEVGDVAPTLSVAITNPGTKPVPFIEFKQPNCFAEFYLRTEIERLGSDTILIKPITCSIRSFPGAKREIQPKERILAKLPLESLFAIKDGWKAGKYTFQVEWKPNFRGIFGGEYEIPAATKSLWSKSFEIRKKGA